MTKAYFRTSLLETLKKDNFYNTAPSGFNINNINSLPIKDKYIIDMIRLQFSLINDFLIRTQLSYTQNIFINEIKNLLESPTPFTDSELIHSLNLDTKQISSLRLNSNINTSPKDLVKSTYLYQLINKHCNLVKSDIGTQTFQTKEIDVKKTIDLEKELKKIDDKYNKKLNMEEVMSYNKLNEKKFLDYKEECDKRYEENLKKEIESFKNIELCNLKLEENKKYLDKIEEIRKNYQKEYDEKYEEIEKMKNDLKEKKSKLEKEYEKKMFDYNEMITEQLKNLREENLRNNRKYANEINNLDNKNKNLEITIDNLKDMHQAQLQKMKTDYQAQIESEKSIMKEENERNQKILFNNFTKNNNELSKIKKQLNNIQNMDKSLTKKELGAIKNPNVNINNLSTFKNSDITKKLAEDAQNRKKVLEDLEEEQSRLNKLMRYEFRNIMNEETPIVLINQDEIDQLKRNDYYNNIIMNERKEVQRKKSQDDNMQANFPNYKDNISPYKNKQSYNTNSTSPFGSKNSVNNKFMNNSVLNNSKNININTSIRNSNMGIGGINYANYNYNNNYNNLNKMNSGVIEENMDYENVSSSQKSKEKKSGNYNNMNMNNINTLNNNIQRTNIAGPILPPINQNQNVTSYSIKEDIDSSASKNRSKIGNTSKKSNEGMNNINLNNMNNNNLFNNNNKSNKFNNINYEKNDDDEYGDGDFVNNISSFNQNSGQNTAQKSVNFGRIKNQYEASMNMQDKNDKQSRLVNNEKEYSESYNDFDNTQGLIKKGINIEGSGNFNNVSRFKNNQITNTQNSDIKEEIEYY
jgi:hypothetical protein